MAGGTLGGKAERYLFRPDAMKFADSLRPSKKPRSSTATLVSAPHCSGSAESKAHRQSGSAYQGCQRQAAPNIAEPGCDLEQGPTAWSI